MKLLDFNIHLDLDKRYGRLHIHADGRPLVGEGTHRLANERLAQLAEAGKRLNANLGRELGCSIGENIFRTLFDGPVGELFQKASAISAEKGNKLRIVLKYDLGTSDEDQLVHQVPWELLYDPQRRVFLAVDDCFVLVRYLRGQGYEWQPPVQPVRALLTDACPSDVQRLDLDAEVSAVCTAFNRIRPAGHLLKSIRSISFNRLRQEFNLASDNALPFHVWHHCGHGHVCQNGTFQLVVHEVDGRRDSSAVNADARSLGEVLVQHPELRLVILNVCLGAWKSGLAPLLASLSVPAVVGFRSEINDASASDFAKSLWRRLPGHPIDVAVQTARASMAQTLQGAGFARVSLFLRSLDRPILTKSPPIKH